jgi:polyisoprenoid-binding protein YceI
VNRTYRLVVASFTFATVTAPSFAAEKYRIDPEHVTVNFTIQHMKWAKYQGTIRTITGDIVFDRENVTASSVRVVMPTDGVDTLNLARDAEARSFGFLNVVRSANITYESTGIEKTGDKTGRIMGNLTMAGVTRPVTLDAVFDGEGVSSWDGKMRVGFSATGRLDTGDFGMSGFADLNIGPKLDFTIEVEGTKQ